MYNIATTVCVFTVCLLIKLFIGMNAVEILLVSNKYTILTAAIWNEL